MNKHSHVRQSLDPKQNTGSHLVPLKKLSPEETGNSGDNDPAVPIPDNDTKRTKEQRRHNPSINT